MRHFACLGLVLALGISGCSGTDDGSDDSAETQAVSDALTRKVNFEGGSLMSGALPQEDAPDVQLVPFEETVVMSPGQTSIMALDTDNPQESEDPVETTLLQFERSKDHFAIMKGSSTENTTGAEVENRFTVESDICDGLCNKKFRLKVHESLKTRMGKVGRRNTRYVELDCTEAGDPSACGDARRQSETEEPGPSVGLGGSGGTSTDVTDGARVYDSLVSVVDSLCGCGLSSESGLSCAEAIGGLERNCVVAAIDTHGSGSGDDLSCALGQLPVVESCAASCDGANLQSCISPVESCPLSLVGVEAAILSACGSAGSVSPGGTGGTGGSGGADARGGSGGAGF